MNNEEVILIYFSLEYVQSFAVWLIKGDSHGESTLRSTAKHNLFIFSIKTNQ
jgi:hypothetical protein